MSDQTPAQEVLPFFYLAIPDLQTLGVLYMPFIRNGGFFIPTSKTCEIGTHIFLLLRLMHEPAKFPVYTKVVWHTPGKAQGNRMSGIGVRFLDRDNMLKGKLETLIAKTDASCIGSAIL